MIHLVTRTIPQISRCITSRHAQDVSQQVRVSVSIQRLMSSDTDFKPSEELAKERYETRAGEDIERKRARLLYQSRKRGMLENGVILASFANKYLHKLDADQLDQYDRLINLPTNDWDIYYWATKTRPTPSEFKTPVLKMLQQHLESKVSNEDKRTDSVLGISKLDEIVLPAKRDKYELDIDVDEVSLTDYEKELFDNRVKKYPGRNSIVHMTEWRKNFLAHRLKRALSSPTSLKNLSDENETKVFTQVAEDRDTMKKIALKRNLIDNEFGKAMKHHDLLQTLLSQNFTDDVTLYDDEAEAWSDMFWHRNYGCDDDDIAPSQDIKCRSCHSKLHCCDPGLSGYVPREIFVSIGTNMKLEDEKGLTCQHCAFGAAYDAKMSHEMSFEDYNNYLSHIAEDKSAVVVVLVDLTDFPGSIWPGLIDLIHGWNKKVIVVGNKLDLLPYDGTKIIERVCHSFRNNLNRIRPDKNKFLDDVMVLSARTGFGVEGLITRILKYFDDSPRNVYLLGNNNSGKSTLFSALLQSDLCAIRKGDLLSRLSKHKLPNSDINMLRFPIDLIEGWEIETRQRKQERVERNTELRERSLVNLTLKRQTSMPHISTLINRLDYPPYDTSGNKSVVETSSFGNGVSRSSKPNFSHDHPLATTTDAKPMSATREIYIHNGFFYQTPSAPHPDQLHNLLTIEERLEVFPNETIVPRRYSIRPLQSIFIAGLARLDLLTARENVIFTIFASRYLPVHVIQTRKADKFYDQFLGSPYLGVPFGDDARMALWPGLVSSQTDFHIRSEGFHIGSADIVLSSVGWALISMVQDHECIVRAFTPERRGIFMRNPPLLSKAKTKSLGKKIRDTPLFDNPYYTIRSRNIESVRQ